MERYLLLGYEKMAVSFTGGGARVRGGALGGGGHGSPWGETVDSGGSFAGGGSRHGTIDDYGHRDFPAAGDGRLWGL